MFEGYKSYFAAAGFVGAALWNLYQKNFDQAYTQLMAALAVFGLRSAIGRKE